MRASAEINPECRKFTGTEGYSVRRAGRQEGWIPAFAGKTKYRKDEIHCLLEKCLAAEYAQDVLDTYERDKAE